MIQVALTPSKSFPVSARHPVRTMFQLIKPLPNMKNLHRYYLVSRQLSKCILAFTLTAGGLYGQVQIDPDLLNPIEKPGYILIFDEEFDGFNSNVWDKSSPGDDNCAYGSNGFCDPNGPD